MSADSYDMLGTTSSNGYASSQDVPADPWEDEPDPRGPDPHDEPDSWLPVDLGPYLRGEITRPTPVVGMARTDGLQLLYPGKENAVIGEMECGKSWYALGCAAAEITAGRHVVYVHFEESDPSDTVERLLALGITGGDMLARFRFVGPERPVTFDALDALLDPAPSLVILDGVNEAMSLHNVDIMSPDGSAVFRRRLVKPCTKAGAAVLSCDHVAKDPDRRGRGPLGSVHKGNAISGTLIVLENVDPFGRGARGASHVFVTKDRPGHLRHHGKPGKVPGKTYLGVLVVDDSQTYSPNLVVKLYAPGADDAEDAEPAGVATISDVEQNVLDTIGKITDAGDTATIRQVRALAAFRNSSVDTALERLLHQRQVVETQGKRGARIFTVPDPTVSQDQPLSAPPLPASTVSRDRVPLERGTRDTVTDDCVP